MKLVNLETFLSMPSGTLFQKYHPTAHLGDLCVKCDRPNSQWTTDFIALNLTNGWPKGPQNSNDFFDLWPLIEKGQEFERDYSVSCRDGLFEEDQLFCVYDATDVSALITVLQNITDTNT